MINVSEVVADPDLATTFEVYRNRGSFKAGGWSVDDEQIIKMVGVVSMSSPKELQQVPEGDRVMGGMTFHSTREIYATCNVEEPGESGVSDRILYLGEFFRVQQVNPYGPYGYWKVIAVRMSGD